MILPTAKRTLVLYSLRIWLGDCLVMYSIKLLYDSSLLLSLKDDSSDMY